MDAHPGYYRQALLSCHKRPSASCATITLLLRSSLGTLVMFLLGCTSDCCCLSPLYMMTIHVTENGKEEQVQKQVKEQNQEIRESTEGPTSVSPPLSFPTAKVQKEIRPSASVPQLVRRTYFSVCWCDM